MKYYERAAVAEAVRLAAKRVGGIPELSRITRANAPNLYEAARNRRHPPRTVLKYLGYERVVRYIKVKR